MTINLAKDWPVFVLVGIVAFFVIWGAIHTRKEEREEREKEERNHKK